MTYYNTTDFNNDNYSYSDETSSVASSAGLALKKQMDIPLCIYYFRSKWYFVDSQVFLTIQEDIPDFALQKLYKKISTNKTVPNSFR